MLTPAGFRTWPCRPIPRSGSPAPCRAPSAAARRGDASRRRPHRHRGADRLCRAALVPVDRAAVHHQLPHPLSRISRGPRCRSRSGWTYALLRRFHNAGRGCMVATEFAAERARRRAASSISCRGRAASTATLFRPARGHARARPAAARSSSLSAASRSRRTSAPSSPSTCRAARWWSATGRRWPALKAGASRGATSSACGPARRWPRPMPRADVFVFPSRTDTFGIVLLEALASGVPVAAYPVPGPADVVGGTGVGVLDEDLRAAALAALEIPRERCRAFALAPELGGLGPPVPRQCRRGQRTRTVRGSEGGCEGRRRADTRRRP